MQKRTNPAFLTQKIGSSRPDASTWLDRSPTLRAVATPRPRMTGTAKLWCYPGTLRRCGPETPRSGSTRAGFCPGP